MKRLLLTAASGLLLLCFAALPARADTQQTYRIQGMDSNRGPFAGELTVVQRDDGRVEAIRDVVFQRSGERERIAGPLSGQGQLRGMLGGSTGLSGLGQQRAPRAVLQVRVDEQGICRGSCLGNAGSSIFSGQAEPSVSSEQSGVDGWDRPQILPAPEQGEASQGDTAQRRPLVDRPLGELPTQQASVGDEQADAADASADRPLREQQASVADEQADAADASADRPLREQQASVADEQADAADASADRPLREQQADAADASADRPLREQQASAADEQADAASVPALPNLDASQARSSSDATSQQGLR